MTGGASERIHLDANATTPPSAAVVEAMTHAAREHWANPSSPHRSGQAARALLERSRAAVAAFIGAPREAIVFTSGASEADDLALRGAVAARPGRRAILVDPTAHAAVLETAQDLAADGVDVRTLPLDRTGRIDAAASVAMLEEGGDDLALVTLSWAQNETGILQPVAELAAAADAAGVPLHADAAQAVGRVPVDLGAVPVHLLTFAGHKMHGPRGVGVLAVRPGTAIVPRIVGGGQERGRRGGTENLPAIAGLAVACEEARTHMVDGTPTRLAGLRDRLQHALVDACPGAIVLGANAPRLPNTLAIALPHAPSEAMLLVLSERGIDASAGSACSSGAIEPSPAAMATLAAMGEDPALAACTLRFSLDGSMTPNEIDRACNATIAAFAVVVSPRGHDDHPPGRRAGC